MAGTHEDAGVREHAEKGRNELLRIVCGCALELEALRVQLLHELLPLAFFSARHHVLARLHRVR
jgi:hypothetical protein